MADPQVFKVPDPANPKEAVYVHFDWQTEKNEAESDKAGLPMFDSILVAYISAPGMTRSEATKVCERKTPDGGVVKNLDAYQRFGAQIEAYKAGENPPDLTGTPLAELSGLDAGIRATLKAMNVHTVEGLASLSDTVQMMGFHKYKTLAKAHMDQANGQAPLLKMAAELQAEKERNDTLTRQVADLAARLDAMDDGSPAKRGPGRPRKLDQEAA